MSGLQLNVGLISGINYVDLVNQLVQIDGISRDNLAARTERLALEKNALQELMSRFLLSSYMIRNLNNAAPYKRTEVSSSNPSLITATRTGTPVVGTYTFTPIQMASAQQTVAKGVASDTEALGKTGTITLGKGWSVENDVKLSDINGGLGFTKGSIRITDGNGFRATIDLRKAVTVNDVVNAINDNHDIDVIAELDNDRIILRDVSGGDLSKFAVQEVSGGTTAASLGLVGGSSQNVDGVLTGSTIWRLGEGMSLDLLNDGNGLVFDGIVFDLSIYCKDGTLVTIDFNKLSTSEEVEAGAPQNRKELTVGDLLNTINSSSNGKVTARISDDGKGLLIEDNTQGERITYIQQNTNSPVLQMLGLNYASPYATMFDGLGDRADQIPAIMEVEDKAGNTVALKLDDGDIYALRAGGMPLLASTLNQKLLNTGVELEFKVNSNGTGLDIIDHSGGTGATQIRNYGDSDLASRLGLTNLSPTSVAAALADVQPGSIRFVDRDGKLADIEITQSDLDAMKASDDVQFIADLFNAKLADTADNVAAAIAGITPGTLRLTDRLGNSVDIEIEASDLAGITSHQDVVDLLNSKIADYNSTVVDDEDKVGIEFLDMGEYEGAGRLRFRDTTGELTGTITIEALDTNGDPVTEGSLAHFYGIDGETTNYQTSGRQDVGSLTPIEINVTVNGNGALVINDTSGGTGTLSVWQPGETYGNGIAAKLGVALNTYADTLVGHSFGDSTLKGEGFNNGKFETRSLLGGMDTVLLSSLNGGYGLNSAKAGLVEVQDRAGNKADLVFSQAELNSLNTLSDAVKLYNAKLADAGIGITVRINDMKTGLEVLDTTGSTSHNLVFKDKAGEITIPGKPAIPGVDAVSGVLSAQEAVSAGWNSSGTFVHEGLGGSAWLSFGNTSLMNGFTFGFTFDDTESGYDADTKTINFLIDDAAKLAVETALTYPPDYAVANAIILASLNGQMADMWEDIYPPDQHGTIPPVEVSFAPGTHDLFAGYALGDADSGNKTAIRQDVTYSTLGRGEGTASLTFEGTHWMNNFTFGFTTHEASAGYDTSAQKFTIFLSPDIMDESDPAEQDRLVKEAIDEQIAAIWADENGGLPGFFRTDGEPGQIKLTDGLGANAILDAQTGGETRIASSLTDSTLGVTPVPAVPETVVSSEGKIASTFGLNVDAASSKVNGTSLHRQIISHNTSLSELNAGSGVNLAGGRFIITDSQGVSQTVVIDAQRHKTVGDIIDAINRLTSVSVMASINANGDGITIEEYGGGTGTFSVRDDGSNSKFAESMGIAGSVPASQRDEDGRGRINMSVAHSIEVEATDSLDDIRKKINDLDAGYSASILVDGSNTPFRLSISSTSTGAAGAFNIDLSAIGLTTETMSEAKDAMIVYGDANTSNGLVLTSGTNNFKGIINGMDLTITGVSDTPVTISSERSSLDVKVSLQMFVENYNRFREYLNEQINYDVTSNGQIRVAEDGGYLWNSSVAKDFDRAVTSMLQQTVTGIPGIHSLADLGITLRRNTSDYLEDIGTNKSTNTLVFDEEKFQAAWDRDPEAVQKFFFDEREHVDSKGEKTTVKIGWAQKFSDLADQLVGAGDMVGKTQARIDTLSQTIDRNEQRILFMEERLEWKRQMYLKQFYAMEQAMARMTSDMSAVGNIASAWSSNYSSGM